MPLYARLWTDILDDPKLRQAAREGAKHLWLLPWLIVFAKRADADGRIEIAGVAADPSLISRSIPNTRPRHVTAALKELREIGILSEDDDGCLFFSAWEYRNSGRASDTKEAIAERVRQHRARRRAARSSTTKADRSSTTATSSAPTEPIVVETYVYYARDNDEVKIGFSRNPWARVHEMRTARPRMGIVAVERGTLELERERHEQFARFRLGTGKGAEWYRWCDAIDAHIRKLTGNDRSVGNNVGNDVGNESERKEERGEKREERRESKKKSGVVGTRSLPPAAAEFGRQFYATAPLSRKRDIKRQLLATLNGGARLRRGVKVLAGSVERLERKCREVIAEGVKDPNQAIVVLLTKLADVSDDSPTERAAADERRDENEAVRRVQIAEAWLEANPDVAAVIDRDVPSDLPDVSRRIIRRAALLKAWTEAGEPTVATAGATP